MARRHYRQRSGTRPHLSGERPQRTSRPRAARRPRKSRSPVNRKPEVLSRRSHAAIAISGPMPAGSPNVSERFHMRVSGIRSSRLCGLPPDRPWFLFKFFANIFSRIRAFGVDGVWLVRRAPPFRRLVWSLPAVRWPIGVLSSTPRRTPGGRRSLDHGVPYRGILHDLNRIRLGCRLRTASAASASFAADFRGGRAPRGTISTPAASDIRSFQSAAVLVIGTPRRRRRRPPTCGFLEPAAQSCSHTMSALMRLERLRPDALCSSDFAAVPAAGAARTICANVASTSIRRIDAELLASLTFTFRR